MRVELDLELTQVKAFRLQSKEVEEERIQRQLLVLLLWGSSCIPIHHVLAVAVVVVGAIGVAVGTPAGLVHLHRLDPLPAMKLKDLTELQIHLLLLLGSATPVAAGGCSAVVDSGGWVDNIVLPHSSCVVVVAAVAVLHLVHSEMYLIEVHTSLELALNLHLHSQQN